jgi:multicomponent Na+:H+ antiporter subunit B
MYSLLLKTMVRILMPLILLFSVFVFARGHQEPGGGFVGGLVAAAGIVLWVVAEGAEEARRRFPVRPSLIAAAGLTCAAVAALIPVALGKPMLTSLWYHLPLPGGGAYDLGTTTLFDLGVYLVVVGTVLLFVFTLELRPSVLAEED